MINDLNIEIGMAINSFTLFARKRAQQDEGRRPSKSSTTTSAHRNFCSFVLFNDDYYSVLKTSCSQQ